MSPIASASRRRVTVGEVSVIVDTALSFLYHCIHYKLVGYELPIRMPAKKTITPPTTT